MKTTTEQPHIVRCPISRELAFPAGFELLREHFGALFDWSEARFYFCNHPTTFASEFTRIVRAQERYRIFRVERCAATQVPEPLPAHWRFTVYPVVRELASIARQALVTQSFETLRRFIATFPRHGNYYNRIDVVFDPVEGVCTAEQPWKA